MRCPDCNKFVSFDTEYEPEIESEEVEALEDEIRVMFTIRRVLPCAECGTELKETVFEFDETFEVDGMTPEQEDHLSIESEATPSERAEGQGRYAKTFYGVDVNFKVTNTEWDTEVITDTLSDDCQASYFDEI